LLFGAQKALLRRLAEREEFSESRKCGRLLVFDAYTDQDPERLPCAIIIWHLPRIFDEYTWKM